MTDHKFTDDENILLLLKWSDDLYANVKLTPEEAKTLFDLINRQKAEIEKWKKNCDELYEQMSERQKVEVDIARRIGKAEAIKEFAKKIKTDAQWICDDNYIEGALIKYVDTLVKEMTEKK